jgi:hypothetical protein
MKKTLLFIFISLSFRLFAQTNVYHPFPDSAFWRVDILVDSPFAGGCLAIYYFQYYPSGDTLINAYVHKKIYKSFVFLSSSGPNSPCNPIPPFQNPGYVGALRDDSVANKAFFVFPSKNNDTLLYDYNLNIGDTIKGFIGSNCIAVIQSLDSVLINGKYRNRWNYNSCGNTNQYLIQGIGTSYGLIEIFTSDPANQIWGRLVCVKDSISTLFISGSGYNSSMGCNLILNGTPEINFENNFKISPNPCTGIFTINSSEKFQYSVYDVFGREVFQSTSLNQTATLDLTSYPKGIYFVRGKAGDKIFARKVILQ